MSSKLFRNVFLCARTLLYPQLLKETPFTRVRWMVRGAAECRFGRAVPGYAEWYCQGTLNLTSTINLMVCLQQEYLVGRETETPSGESPRARPRRRAANRRGRDQDAERRSAVGGHSSKSSRIATQTAARAAEYAPGIEQGTFFFGKNRWFEQNLNLC